MSGSHIFNFQECFLVLCIFFFSVKATCFMGTKFLTLCTQMTGANCLFHFSRWQPQVHLKSQQEGLYSGMFHYLLSHTRILATSSQVSPFILEEVLLFPSQGVNFKPTVMLRLWGRGLGWYTSWMLPNDDTIFWPHWVMCLVSTYGLHLEPLQETPSKNNPGYGFLNQFSVCSGLCYFCFVSPVTAHVCFLSSRIALTTLVHCWSSLLFSCCFGFIHFCTPLFSFQWCFVRVRERMNALRPPSWTKRY